MGARQAVVMGGLLLLLRAGTADAQSATLEPSKLSVFVPSGWQVMRERAGDFLHYETAAAGGRSFDLTFERVASKCKTWKASAGTRKQLPLYWPKAARTGLFTARGDGKVMSTGCLADVAGGARRRDRDHRRGPEVQARCGGHHRVARCARCRDGGRR